MKVYRVEPYAKPLDSKFLNYAQLQCKKTDEGFLRTEYFSGRPFPKPWRRVKLHFEEPLYPRADFYALGLGNFVCTERARTLAGPALERSGEFLPVTIEGEEGVHYIYNVTDCGDYIDETRSIWEHSADEPEDLEKRKEWKARQVKLGYIKFRTIVGPAFDPHKVETQRVLKVSESPWTLYCVEQTGDPAKGELKALVEYHKLAGLRFDLAWSEAQGPVPWNCPPLKGSPYIWRTGDGKRYKAE